jgi:hypothetical protein
MVRATCWNIKASSLACIYRGAVSVNIQNYMYEGKFFI